MTEAEKILASIGKRAATGKGIGLALYYLKTAEAILPRLGLDVQAGFPAALRAASQLLVYRSEVTPTVSGIKSAGWNGLTLKEEEKPVAEKACMIFECVLTSVKQDRDGDILEPKGAELDPLMPLLWQHMPMMPIGKFLRVTDRNDDLVKTLYAIADTELGRDAAVLVDFGALRISHGFAPKLFEPLKDGETDHPTPGWRVQKYEVMEGSLVSIPSNTDAVITARSQGKLHSPFIKGLADAEWDKLPQAVRSGWDAQKGGGLVVIVNNAPPAASQPSYLELAGKGKKSHVAKDDDEDKDDEETDKDDDAEKDEEEADEEARPDIPNVSQLRDDLRKILEDGGDKLDDATRQRIADAIEDCSELIGAEAERQGKFDDAVDQTGKEDEEEDEDAEKGDDEEKFDDAIKDDDEEEDDAEEDDEDADLEDTGNEDKTEPDEDERADNDSGDDTDKDDEGEKEDDDKDDDEDKDDEEEEEKDDDAEDKEDEDDDDREETDADADAKEDDEDEDDKDDEEETKECVSCGKAAAKDSGYCPGCGVKFDDAIDQTGKDADDDDLLEDMDVNEDDDKAAMTRGFSTKCRDSAWLLIAELNCLARVRTATLEELRVAVEAALKREKRIKLRRELS